MNFQAISQSKGLVQIVALSLEDFARFLDGSIKTIEVGAGTSAVYLIAAETPEDCMRRFEELGMVNESTVVIPRPPGWPSTKDGS